MSDYQARLFETLLREMLRELKELKRELKNLNQELNIRKDDGK